MSAVGGGGDPLEIPGGPKGGSEAARRDRVRRNLAGRALVALRSLLRPEASAGTDAAAVAGGLAGLAASLLGGDGGILRPDANCAPKPQPPAPNPQRPPAELFPCFRDWFWAATAAGGDRVAWEVSAALLSLSCRLGFGFRGDRADDPSLAAVVLSVEPGAFRDLAVGESARGRKVRDCLVDQLGGDGARPVFFGQLSRLARALSAEGDGAALIAARDAIAGREVFLLTNVIFLSTRDDDLRSVAPALVQVLRHVLLRRTDVSNLAALAAKGDDVAAMVLRPSAKEVSDMMDLTNDDGDDSSSVDSDNEEMEDPPPVGRRATTASVVSSPSFRRAQSSGRLTRQQLQTVPKLNRLYQMGIVNVRRETSTAVSSSGCVVALVDLAVQIGGGGGSGSGDSVVIRLGEALFNGGGGAIGPGLGDPLSLVEAQLSYVAVLSDLLRFCASSQPHGHGVSVRSLLGRLVFRPRLLISIWTIYVAMAARAGEGDDPRRDGTLASFCEVFAHHLTAVDDEEFLGRYGGGGGSAAEGTDGQIIASVDVVSALRSALYDLYWSRPVLASDASSMPSSSSQGGSIGEAVTRSTDRVRLLLSGTKLWNSLYERWCRLYHTNPFCPENTWWFPKMVTSERDEQGAIIGASSAAAATSHQDEDMDDDDSADFPIDADGHSDGGGA